MRRTVPRSGSVRPHFYMSSAKAGHFSNETGSPFPTWTRLPVTGDISDGPTLTSSDSDVGMSVCFRRGGQFMQIFGFPLGSGARRR
jgi:hypothetical protein